MYTHEKAQQIIQVVSQINLWITFKLEASIYPTSTQKKVCQHPLKSTHGNPNMNFSAWRYGGIRCVDTVASISSLSECWRSKLIQRYRSTYFTSVENSQSMKNSRHHNWNISLKYCRAASLSRFFLVFISMKWCNSLAEAAKSWHWRALKDAGFLQGWGG